MMTKTTGFETISKTVYRPMIKPRPLVPAAIASMAKSCRSAPTRRPYIIMVRRF